MAITGQIAPSARESTTQASRSGERLLDRIGNTPLLRLERLGREFSHVEFYAKAEWFNPGGSVKDRPALNIIQAGLASGALKRGKAIIDATSGNTGIAYAMRSEERRVGKEFRSRSSADNNKNNDRGER